jgi:hypothetical protein
MKDFILDSTYKDATIVNSNDDILTVSLSKLPFNSISHHSINLIKTSSNYSNNHNSNDKFNSYNLIDYL